MKIDHIAIWTKDLERLKSFYEIYFQAKAGKKYINSIKNFQSYFLHFDNGCRLELMHKPEIRNFNDPVFQNLGLIHFAISVGSKEKVDSLTSDLKQGGFEVLDGPRTTGDGYYESVILDPESNRIEITI